MSGRDPRRRPTASGDGTPVDSVPASASVKAATTGEVDGLNLAPAAETRGGEDARRRGWFWHWNSIVTQYAPLLGLKGVGLLNSYTVWTDRREESPHRGYAFPSQQSEADFYGEDRAELITINKILVALDLIEIRKEMVLRTDERGRRWRVPHNFYRVKDHADGFGLTARDVLRVVELADRDKAVYRYVRRIFSPRFAPIDHDNAWHRILPELRGTEPWRRLAARAAAEEDRASARTRAGHAARRAPGDPTPEVGVVAGADFFVPDTGDDAATTRNQNDTARGASPTPLTTSVATSNEGSNPDVGDANNGSTAKRATSVGPANQAGPTAVEPSNRTYHQDDLTTTTRHDPQESEPPPAAETGAAARPLHRAPPYRHPAANAHPAEAGNLDTTPRLPSPVPQLLPTGPGDHDAPADAPGEAAAIRSFEEANARPATPAERNLLRGLADRFDPAARSATDPASGWAWVAAAVYEAVDAGSAFVAPRRIREILGRWEREGFPSDPTAPTTSSPTAARGERRRSPAAGAGKEAVLAGSNPGGSTGPAPVEFLGAGPDLPLPHGHGSRRTWAFAVGLLGAALDRDTLLDLVAGTAIVGYRDGEVTIAVPDAVQADRLATTYHDLVARKLSEAMRRPVRLALLVAAPPSPDRSDPASSTGAVRLAAPPPSPGSTTEPAADPPAIPSFLVAECGLPSGQVWSAVLAEVAAGPVPRADLDAWLRSTALLGRGGDGGAGSPLVVGVTHALAQRRVADRFAPHLRAAVAAVVGRPLPLDVVVARDWLLAHASDTPPSVPSLGTDQEKRGA